MKQTNAQLILHFLKGFPPFDALTDEQLQTIAQEVKVLYLEKDNFIFKQNEPLHDYFYVVKDGAIGVFRQSDLVDKCDTGDVFGLRALIRKDQYLLDAKAIEDSIVYSIPSKLLEDIIINNPKANQFLIASFATNTRNPYSDEDKGTLFANIGILKPETSNFTEIQSAKYSTNPSVCEPGTSIKEAAIIMSQNKVGSIVITDNKKPIGIITDKDLRHKVATGIHAITEPVEAIMYAPVFTFPKNISVAEAQIGLLKNDLTYLCITKDGTPNSELIGILSQQDIIVVNGNNPSVLIKDIKRANSAESLKYIRAKAQDLLKGYLKQSIPIGFISKIITAINEAITKRIIDLSIAEFNQEPPVSFAWLAIGSQGRKEQLLYTDQDNALVYEDSTEDIKTKAYFLKLAEAVNQKLAIVGFKLCPANMMASNPKWCLTVSDWQAQFSNWITHADQDKMALFNIFFDYNYVYGNQNLVSSMSDYVFETLETNPIFLTYMGRNAIKKPAPLSFFKTFLVEISGEHKNQFDIKSRAIMPLVDAARVLLLSHHVKDINSTIARFKKLSELEPQHKALYNSCINAFRVLLRFRTKQGLKHNDSGQFVDVKNLSKNNKLKLKGCFKPIKDIQELLHGRYKLSQLP
ncbi:DUF294 nucleotidyltransferase-like domain-containing protein [uncultured Olleya sp.]|uniref:DUF294 nucleotidyltransferase-like domain-containing protein n=1 Tax=uncultured Olleya sp. TaxID=757243 RepID=UPI00259185C0|nr:DUF294 nucleotidyltransferase-like domain-containing protein [uncultured Olleya sp.]